MTEGELILDYASPRPRGRVRLPSQSHLAIAHDRDTTTVTESLRGKSSAVVAMCFAVFVLVVLILVIAGQFVACRQHPQSFFLVEPIILTCLWIAEAWVGVLVLDQTYRQTIVQVRDGEMTLTFSALLSQTRHHRWPMAEVGQLTVHPTQSGAGLPPLAELRLQPARDVAVHLFTDHREQDVLHIAALLRSALRGEVAPPLASPASPTTANVAPDEETFNRLVRRHRNLRTVDRSKQIDNSP